MPVACSASRQSSHDGTSTSSSSSSTATAATSSNSRSTQPAATFAAARGRARARRDVYRDLFTSLAQSFTKESLPWISDLVAPVLSGPPEPLSDTRDPKSLADPDSRFIDLDMGAAGPSILIHYKEWVATSAAAASGDVPQGGVPQRTSGVPSLLMMHGFNGSEFNYRGVAPGIAQLVADAAALVSRADRKISQLQALQNLPSLDVDASLGLSAASQRDPAASGSASDQPDGDLPRSCRAIAFDRPPFGLSGRPASWSDPATDPYTNAGAAELASRLAGALELQGVSTSAASPDAGDSNGSSSRAGGGVIVMGHSAGGPIALELAARRPDLVSGVVLIAPALSVDPKGLLGRLDLGQLLRFAITRAIIQNDNTGLQYIRRSIRKREEEVRRGELGIYYDDSEFAREEVIEGYLRPLKAHDWDKGSLAVARSFSLGSSSAESTRATLRAVKAPILILQGTDDRAVLASTARALAQAAREERPGSVTQYVELKQCGHLPMEELPSRFTDTVSDFIVNHCM